MSERLRSAVFALSTALAVLPTAAFAQQTVCVYDPLGANGPAYKMAEQMSVAATQQYGISISLRAAVEEKTVSDDLAAGKCDGAVVTGVRVRSFGLKSATLEAIGALPTYLSLQHAIYNLAREEASSLMRTGSYETAGIFPGGAVYLFVRDGSVRSAAQLAGKKISTISGDEAAATMVREIGASALGATTATFGPMFNSGSVDAAYAPATAYEPLELYRGVGSSGGIIDFPLTQLTLQLVIRADKFPEGFGLWGRVWAYTQFDAAMAKVNAAEAKVKAKMLTIPDADKPGYDSKFQSVRVRLRDQGIYDGKILTMMRRIRCQFWPGRAECAAPAE